MAFLDCFVASRFAALAEKAPRNDGADMAAILAFPKAVIASEAKQSREYEETKTAMSKNALARTKNRRSPRETATPNS